MDICLPLVTTRSVRGTIHIRSGRQSIGRSLAQAIVQRFCEFHLAIKTLAGSTGSDHEDAPRLDPRCLLNPNRRVVRFVDLVRRFWEENSFCE